ncbi:MAG: hypothetical protein O2960_20740 [Verrucomicrobia bacterium]|nr:hypothetical protein [Verrucomicrobiota bacterium]
MNRIELTRVERDLSGRIRSAGKAIVDVLDIVRIVERPGITTIVLKACELQVSESFSEIDRLMTLSRNRRLR